MPLTRTRDHPTGETTMSRELTAEQYENAYNLFRDIADRNGMDHARDTLRRIADSFSIHITTSDLDDWEERYNKHSPDTYLGVPVPSALRHNWDSVHATWWRTGVKHTLDATDSVETS